jgi:D-3-phosphoglycerate dehydrogenase
MRKVIISGAAHPILQSTLTNSGYDVLYRPTITREELLQHINSAEGLIVTTRIVVDKEMIDAGKQLKWIGRLGSGMELIDVEYAKTKNIQCVSSPEGNRRAVAEHCLGMLLNVLHKISVSHQQIKEGVWLRDENRGTELSGKKVGIIGFGNTGSQFAQLLQPFGVTVLAYDKYHRGFSSDQVVEVDLATIQSEADVISFHVPLTNETQQMANESFFSALKKKPVIINSARGKVVDLSALASGLNKGLVSGACLDVLPNENLASYTDKEKQLLDQLLAMPQVIITPHIAGYSHEASVLMATVVLKKLGIN